MVLRMAADAGAAGALALGVAEPRQPHEASWSVDPSRRWPDHTFRIPQGFRLRPGRTVTIHTGRGRNDRNDLFMKLGFYVWNNEEQDSGSLVKL